MFLLKTALDPIVIKFTEGPDTNSTYSTSPFGSDSLWNLRVVNPVFDNSFEIPYVANRDYLSAIEVGKYSTGFIEAKATDPQVVVKGLTSAGINDARAERRVTGVAIPR
jgi:hypothetical protein